MTEFGIQSEAALEAKLIETLVNMGYEFITVPNEETLLKNFKSQIETHNIKSKVIEKPFSDIEFFRLLNLTAKSGKGVFQSASNLRQKQLLELDNGKKVYIELFNQNEWCKNKFQITNQITIEGHRVNRYDVTLLINGIPMVQIELKRRGMELKQAFNQINRYKRESFKELFNFTQIFVVSNGVNTKYVSNSDGHLRYEQAFFWTDEHNVKITDLDAFSLSFLAPCHISKMIARYMVVNQTDKALMVMRPYQVYAVEKLMSLASETRNNGYVWHTTGSGKTLTSFKLAQLLADYKDVEKVIFLVDRKDLDAQTLSEFNKFEKDSVDMTSDTKTLVEQLNDPTKRLLITTIQKMDNAIKKKRYEKALSSYKEKRVIFIIDECHRSQFGDMHKRIKTFFEKAQYFGFTGTPIFQETAKNELATGDLFGRQVHQYLIKDAIDDGNVLAFKIDYLRSFNLSVKAVDVDVEDIDKTEIIESPTRIENVVKRVLEIHNIKTNHREFNALFAASSIKMANLYYEKFKELNQDLVIAQIFSYNPNDEIGENEKLDRDKLEDSIREYNQQFNTNFTTDTYNLYFSDVSKRFKRKEIDILIVVNMFLTGFDSKALNTLYLDKKLQHHNLIQAFSRTNRVDTPRKPFGNIVSFLTRKDDVDAAIKLYSKRDATDTVLLKPYEEYVKSARVWVNRMKEMVPNVQSVNDLEGAKRLAEFVELFRGLSRVLNTLKNFIEFSFTEEEIGISQQEYEDYKSKYLDLVRTTEQKEKVSVLADVDFEIELLTRDRVDVDYIIALLADIDLENKEQKEKDIEKVRKVLDQNDTTALHSKIELLRRFIERVVPTLEKNADITNEYYEFVDKEKEKKLEDISAEIDVEKFIVREIFAEYTFSGIIPNQKIVDVIKGKFKEKREKRKKLVETLEEVNSYY